jgi:hypothetical protein
MKVIRYGLHFATLTVAVVVFWVAKDLTFFERVFNFNFFPFALMGALHATSIVVSLRDRRTTHPIIEFLILALCFITLAALWSAATPIMGLWGSIVWTPLQDILHWLGNRRRGILAVGSPILVEVTSTDGLA